VEQTGRADRTTLTRNAVRFSQSGIAALGLVASPDASVSDMEYVQGTAGSVPRPGRPMGALRLPHVPELDPWKGRVANL